MHLIWIQWNCCKDVGFDSDRIGSNQIGTDNSFPPFFSFFFLFNITLNVAINVWNWWRRRHHIRQPKPILIVAHRVRHSGLPSGDPHTDSSREANPNCSVRSRQDPTAGVVCVLLITQLCTHPATCFRLVLWVSFGLHCYLTITWTEEWKNRRSLSASFLFDRTSKGRAFRSIRSRFS